MPTHTSTSLGQQQSEQKQGYYPLPSLPEKRNAQISKVVCPGPGEEVQLDLNPSWNTDGQLRLRKVLELARGHMTKWQS